MDFYIFTTAITRPLFTYITFSFLLCNLILEKLLSVLNVESGKFFLALSYLVSFAVGVVVVVVVV